MIIKKKDKHIRVWYFLIILCLTFFIFANKKIFIIVSKYIITNETIFNILMKFFKKFQLIIATHNIDIINDIDSNIIINTTITVNDIEFKQFFFYWDNYHSLLFL